MYKYPQISIVVCNFSLSSECLILLTVLSNDMSTMSYNSPEFVELYDTRYGKFSFYHTCKASKHDKSRVLQVIRLSNEGGGEAYYHLGSSLSDKQAILVSQARGRFVAIAGSCHETSTNCQYVSSGLQCSLKLGVLLWGCRKTTNGTPRESTSWHTPRIYVPKAVPDLR